MFKIIGEHLLLRRNYLIRYFKKRFRKTLPDAIRVSIAIVKTFEIYIWQFFEDFVFKLGKIHRNENDL